MQHIWRLSNISFILSYKPVVGEAAKDCKIVASVHATRAQAESVTEQTGN